MKEIFAYGEKDTINYGKVYEYLKNTLKKYLSDNNIKACVIGVSGGLDSGINTVLTSEVCKELNIPFLGRYIHIETNKEEEKHRAELIGNLFCTDFKSIDLTEGYLALRPHIEEKEVDENDIETKFNRGNIKCRLRMIYLYNLARENGGIIIDNDNYTEHMLGFYTLNGDVFDVSPLAHLWKTECYELAKWMLENQENEEAREAIQLLIDAVPTDGLGITSSDIEQFGCKSYAEVDDIIKTFFWPRSYYGYAPKSEGARDMVGMKYGYDVVDKVLNRVKSNEFKKQHPKGFYIFPSDIRKFVD